MKTTLEESKPEARTHIDTSRMNAGQRAALEMAEAARDERRNTGIAAGIFFGEPNFGKLLPFPKQSGEDHDQGDAFLHLLEGVLDAYADPDEIDASGEIPEVLLGHFVDVGADLFVWGCTLAHAQSKVNDSSMAEVEIDKLVRLVRFFGKMTRERIETLSVKTL